MIIMDSKTQLKVDIIAKVSSGKISIRNAGKILKKSKRTIERYISAYRLEGVSFFVHKNSKKAPVNRISRSTVSKVQKLIKTKYFDFNLTHLREKLEDEENIDVKRESLRKWAHEISHVKREKKRRRVIRKRRERMESPGLLLQMDGSTHCWFGKSKSCLIAIIDDANSELHAQFFESETTLGCMKVIKDVIIRRGAFKTLYVDRAGIFAGPKRSHFSQVQRACRELGIEIIFANSPEGKGRIERSFNTLQDRLIPELRIKNIKTMKNSNTFLKEKFIPRFWTRNIMVKPESRKSEYSKLTKSNLKKLNSIFTVKQYRKIKRDHTFSYNGELFLITSKLTHSLVNYKIEVRTTLTGKLEYYFSDSQLTVKKVREPARPCVKEIIAEERVEAVKLSIRLGSVSRASRETGVSRQAIYRAHEILEQKGKAYFIKSFGKGACFQNESKKKVESKVVKFCLENPQLGEDQATRHLNKILKNNISSGTVRNIWLRNKMQTIALRVIKSKSI